MKKIVYAGVVILALVGIVAGVGYALPKSHVVSRHIVLHQPPDQVYALISGPSTWRIGVKKYEPAPGGGGRVWTETDDYDNAVTYERMVNDPPRHLVTRISSQLAYGGVWTYELTPTADGTDLRITENGEVFNPIFRFLSRFVFGNSATIEKYLAETAQHFGEKPKILP